MPPRPSSRQWRGKTNNEEHTAWQCIRVYYPLEKIVKIFTIVDFIRGVLDTINTTGILALLLELDYSDIQLPPTAVLSNSNNYIASRNFYLNNRKRDVAFTLSCSTLVAMLSVTVVLCLADVPLSVMLYRAADTKNRRKCNLWLQFTGVLLFFNFIVYTSIMLYSKKAGVVRDDLAMASQGSLFMVYSSVLRVALYDFTKGAEMIFVTGFLREMRKRARLSRAFA